MKLNYFGRHPLSQPARDLIQFDIDSIRQIVAGRHGVMPEVWLAVPEAYEKNGRALRDSETPRLLAYSTLAATLYATDGCNACARQLDRRLEDLSADQLKTFADMNEMRLDVLEALRSLLRAA
jgi:hypothetical protein